MWVELVDDELSELRSNEPEREPEDGIENGGSESSEEE
jgi:hypothetical protein